jgi:hypothetical protein
MRTEHYCKTEGKRKLEDLCVDGRIILKYMKTY